MKRLILIRHSKSSWKDVSLTDFNRPLNGRGKSDGPLMADYLKSKINKIDYLQSSSSDRTIENSKYFINTTPLFSLIDNLFPAVLNA